MLDVLVELISDWQRKTFPGATTTGAFLHLASEVGELCSALKLEPADETKALRRFDDGTLKEPGSVEEEMADTFFLLVQVANLSGVNLAEAVSRKFQKNKARTWKSADENGVYEHASEGDV